MKQPMPTVTAMSTKGASGSLHVIVIGGGIGGLCLAQGLRKAGVSVAVYERDRAPDARLQGYRLSIEPPGSAALHECLPEVLWQLLVALSGDQGERMGAFDQRLRELMREDPKAAARDPASGSHAVSRVTLRQVLLAGLDPVVHFGKELTRYELDGDNQVTAHFADGTWATGPVLVGADGARSRVRRQLLPDARRIEVPAIGVGGKLPLTGQSGGWLPPWLARGRTWCCRGATSCSPQCGPPREDPAALIARLGDQLRSAGLAAEGLLGEAADNDYLMWAFVAHRRSYPAGLEGKALLDAVRQRVRRWHPDLRRLVAESDPGSAQQFEFAAATRVRSWPAGRVTLLGDAIHCMPPVGGMGGNTALQDASRLCHALAAADRSGQPLGVAIEAYQDEMLARGFATVRGVRLYTALAISRSRLLRAAARGFFRLCGAAGPLRRAVFDE
jgi:2-polyprenyl-6-methoxyphenol hydroxylase-like FAD-dependent oxidoreductase